MHYYAESLTEYRRLKTRTVKVGELLLGYGHPIRLQTMTTTDTMDTAATVAQAIRCIEAGAELVRITAPSKKEAENLENIKKELNKRGYHTPLVADIHFTPNAAEIAARIIEKVRVNPGNYVDKKKFEQIDYTDREYLEEMERIRDRFTPLVNICKEYGTAMRIGTNHGSLSDRIMSRYGDTPMGMVESAMEFLRIARQESYHNIVLSMKSSNPQVMVQAYRLLVQTMDREFGECYPLHLGVTEAGDGEDGRIKSAAGMGTLLEDGIGDTVRVSLTEEPEAEIPVCRALVSRYEQWETTEAIGEQLILPYNPFAYKRRQSNPVANIGGGQVPVVIADYRNLSSISPKDLEAIGYTYEQATDKWHISDSAADYILVGDQALPFALPGTLRVILPYEHWPAVADKEKYFPLLSREQYLEEPLGKSAGMNFVGIAFSGEEDEVSGYAEVFLRCKNDPSAVLLMHSGRKNAVQHMRSIWATLSANEVDSPVVLMCRGHAGNADDQLIHYATETGALLLDGFGDGICLTDARPASIALPVLNSIAFGILQATRTRISKTEYISCPSCGRTLFDLQETTARIRRRTHHLKGIKIAIMGCIVNGPGEMADADFGYVGSGVGKITLYKGKEVVKRGIDSEVAVEELINLLKENEAWVDPAVPLTEIEGL